MRHGFLIIYIITLFLSSQLCAFEKETITQYSNIKNNAENPPIPPLSKGGEGGFSGGKIAELQDQVKDKSLADRIAFWAEQFIGTPYDTDPLGEYVRNNEIVSDERVDCMYHVFRSLELALSNTPEESVKKALNMRFHSKGMLKDNVVINYDDRFQEGIDMILSGKWGKDITEELGKTTFIEGSKKIDKQKILLKEDAIQAAGKLKNGDIIFFIKNPKTRVRDEIVGHMGIIKIEGSNIYLIHASGQKRDPHVLITGNNGVVKKVLFIDYIKSMKFIGIKVTRF